MPRTPLLAPDDYFARDDALALRRALLVVVAFWLARGATRHWNSGRPRRIPAGLCLGSVRLAAGTRARLYLGRETARSTAWLVAGICAALLVLEASTAFV